MLEEMERLKRMALNKPTEPKQQPGLSVESLRIREEANRLEAEKAQMLEEMERLKCMANIQPPEPKQQPGLSLESMRVREEANRLAAEKAQMLEEMERLKRMASIKKTPEPQQQGLSLESLRIREEAKKLEEEKARMMEEMERLKRMALNQPPEPKSPGLSLESMRAREEAKRLEEEKARMMEEMELLKKMMMAKEKEKNAPPPPSLDKTHNLLRPASSGNTTVDVCFLMDCTGSMGDWIEAAQQKIVEIISQVKPQFPAAQPRVAFTGYRDFSEGEQRLVVKPFTANVEQVRQFISGVRAFGGGDAAEDVIGGL